jgi:hypothetical protein
MLRCKYAVVGIDDLDNLRLAQTLRKIHGKESVFRFLDLDHLEPFLGKNEGQGIVVCLDLLGYDPKDCTGMIGRIRDAFPKVVFTLYLNKNDYQARASEIPSKWRTRLSHYYKLYKEDPEAEIEPVVRASLAGPEWEAMRNLTNEPIRLTPVFQKGLVGPRSIAESPVNAPAETVANTGNSAGPITFVSYSRSDWDDFVAGLVADLSKQSQQIWIDQDYIVGGDDWMDAIGQALQACESLLLVLSPNAINSKYVKMEYRYFFNQEKPIIPVLYQKVLQLPFELATLQYVDFTREDRTKSNLELLKVLARRRR